MRLVAGAAGGLQVRRQSRPTQFPTLELGGCEGAPRRAGGLSAAGTRPRLRRVRGLQWACICAQWRVHCPQTALAGPASACVQELTCQGGANVRLRSNRAFGAPQFFGVRQPPRHRVAGRNTQVQTLAACPCNQQLNMRAVVAPVALARGTGTVPRRLGSVPAGNGRVIPTARRAPRPYYNQRAQGTSLVVAQSSNTVAVTFTLARKVGPSGAAGCRLRAAAGCRRLAQLARQSPQPAACLQQQGQQPGRAGSAVSSQGPASGPAQQSTRPPAGPLRPPPAAHACVWAAPHACVQGAAFSHLSRALRLPAPAAGQLWAVAGAGGQC